MLTDEIIDTGLRFDADEADDPRGRIAYHDIPFVDHAIANYAAALSEVRRLREAIAEQFLLQYGKEPDALERAIDKLLQMRKDRLALDDALEAE